MLDEALFAEAVLERLDGCFLLNLKGHIALVCTLAVRIENVEDFCFEFAAALRRKCDFRPEVVLFCKSREAVHEKFIIFVFSSGK